MAQERADGSWNLLGFHLKGPGGSSVDVVWCTLLCFGLGSGKLLRDGGLSQAGIEGGCIQEARPGMVCTAPSFPFLVAFHA